MSDYPAAVPEEVIAEFEDGLEGYLKQWTADFEKHLDDEDESAR
jgi:hypothetical protein